MDHFDNIGCRVWNDLEIVCNIFRSSKCLYCCNSIVGVDREIKIEINFRTVRE